MSSYNIYIFIYYLFIINFNFIILYFIPFIQPGLGLWFVQIRVRLSSCVRHLDRGRVGHQLQHLLSLLDQTLQVLPAVAILIPDIIDRYSLLFLPARDPTFY